MVNNGITWDFMDRQGEVWDKMQKAAEYFSAV